MKARSGRGKTLIIGTALTHKASRGPVAGQLSRPKRLEFTRPSRSISFGTKDIVPTELLDILRQRRDFHVFDYWAPIFSPTHAKPLMMRVRQALALVIDKRS